MSSRFNRTRDKSGHSGQGDKQATKSVPTWSPDFLRLGTGSRDTFESINTVLSRLSRPVPSEIERGGRMTKPQNGTRRKAKTPTQVDYDIRKASKEKLLKRVTASGDVGLPANQAAAMAEAKRMLAQAGGVKDLDLAA